MDGLAGVTATETRFGGLSVAGSYTSALANGKLLSAPPATRTVPSKRSDALWPERPWVRLPEAEKVWATGS